jgi:hypothetical protein
MHTAVQISQDLRKALLISLCLRDHLQSFQNEVPIAAFGASLAKAAAGAAQMKRKENGFR